jgi:hypothetical protein
MPVVYRPWISPYGDDDFEWDRNKSLIISLRRGNATEREIYYEHTT